ncbi:type IV pilus biogenesis protein PilM [Paenibacillus sp. SAF-054]|uniref:type IV pilus biogenesis protein PilM n=1 Tax=unclassified Paenibacillus TaxID=185978 RepID=UPI003F7E622A
MFQFKRGRESYGLQVTDTQIRFVEVNHSSKSINLAYHFAFPLQNGAVRNGRIMNEEAVVKALEAIAQESGAGGADIHLSVPTSSVVMRRATYPAVNDRELRNMIDIDLNGSNSLPFKDPVFDFVRLETVEANDTEKAKGVKKQVEVLIFATPSEVISSYVEAMQKAGLEPASVDIAPLAAYRLLVKYHKLTGIRLPERFMFVNMEADQVEFSMFENGLPVFLRSMPLMNSSYMLGSDQDRMTSYGRNLTTELERMMQYFKNKASANQEDLQELFLMGEESFINGVPTMLADVFQGPIQAIPLDELLQEGQMNYQSFAVPIGLALKGA